MKFKEPSAYIIYFTSGTVFLSLLAGISYLEQGFVPYFAWTLLIFSFIIFIYSRFFLVTSPLSLFQGSRYKKLSRLRLFILETATVSASLVVGFFVYDYFSPNKFLGFIFSLIPIVFILLLIEKLLKINK